MGPNAAAPFCYVAASRRLRRNAGSRTAYGDAAGHPSGTDRRASRSTRPQTFPVTAPHPGRLLGRARPIWGRFRNVLRARLDNVSCISTPKSADELQRPCTAAATIGQARGPTRPRCAVVPGSPAGRDGACSTKARAPGDPRRLGRSLGQAPHRTPASPGRPGLDPPGEREQVLVLLEAGDLTLCRSGYASTTITASAPGPRRCGSGPRRWSGRTRPCRTARRRSTRQPSGSWR